MAHQWSIASFTVRLRFRAAVDFDRDLDGPSQMPGRGALPKRPDHVSGRRGERNTLDDRGLDIPTRGLLVQARGKLTFYPPRRS